MHRNATRTANPMKKKYDKAGLLLIQLGLLVVLGILLISYLGISIAGRLGVLSPDDYVRLLREIMIWETFEQGTTLSSGANQRFEWWSHIIERGSTGFLLDTFTGNGSATAFTLSNAVPVNDAFVFYNGICMQPTTDYGISGVTLTFTFTPLNSSNIMVRYQV